ncbi:MAG: AAA family ATPase [Pseudomonadota bacterium]
MLTHFAITNFKVFGKRQCFDLAPITLIYGPNSGGKSSIIQAMLLLKQSIEAPINQGIRDRVLVPKGRYVDLGQSKSIHHKHSFDNKISFEVGMKMSGPLVRHFASMFAKGGEFSAALSFEQREESIRLKLPTLSTIRYRSRQLGDSSLDLAIVRGQKATRRSDEEQLEFDEFTDPRSASNFFNFANLSEIHRFNKFLASVPINRAEEYRKDFFDVGDVKEEKDKNRYQVGFRPAINGKATFLPSSARNLSKADPKRSVGREDMLEIPSSALSQIARVLNVHFESMAYLGPLRSRPKRLYELSQQYDGSIGLSGEYAVEALRTDFEADSGDGVSVVDFVNDWLRRFEVPYTVGIEEVGDEVLGDLAMLKLHDNRTGVTVAATDVGFGIGQLLPVIIQAALASRSGNPTLRPRTICIEQPEIHLHPRLQANVADLLISTAQESECQWIIETHSEALMLRVQRRIREGTLKAESVAVVFVEPSGENGSRILNLKLDQQGNFINEWPGGFFEDSFAEMFS